MVILAGLHWPVNCQEGCPNDRTEVQNNALPVA
jgi:hypothetical protein